MTSKSKNRTFSNVLAWINWISILQFMCNLRSSPANPPQSISDIIIIQLYYYNIYNTCCANSRTLWKLCRYTYLSIWRYRSTFYSFEYRSIYFDQNSYLYILRTIIFYYYICIKPLDRECSPTPYYCVPYRYTYFAVFVYNTIFIQFVTIILH